MNTPWTTSTAPCTSHITAARVPEDPVVTMTNVNFLASLLDTHISLEANSPCRKKNISACLVADAHSTRLEQHEWFLEVVLLWEIRRCHEASAQQHQILRVINWNQHARQIEMQFRCALRLRSPTYMWSAQFVFTQFLPYTYRFTWPCKRTCHTKQTSKLIADSYTNTVPVCQSSHAENARYHALHLLPDTEHCLQTRGTDCRHQPAFPAHARLACSK